MPTCYILEPARKLELLLAMMHALAGSGSRISFEGRLRNTGLARLHHATFSEIGLLRRKAVLPRLDLVIFPLTSAQLDPLRHEIVSRVPLSPKGIVHVQIEVCGVLAFASYDSFTRGRVFASEAVPQSFLDELVRIRILRSYSTA